MTPRWWGWQSIEGSVATSGLAAAAGIDEPVADLWGKCQLQMIKVRKSRAPKCRFETGTKLYDALD